MAKVGAKPRLARPAIRTKLLDAIRAGATHELACKYAGMSPRQFYVMMARGRAGDPEWTSLVEEVEEAEGAGSVQCLAVIRKAALGGQWQAAAWLLERRFPQMYGRTVQEVQDGGKAPALTDEERADHILRILDAPGKRTAG